MKIKSLKLLKMVVLLFFVFTIKCYGAKMKVLTEYLEFTGGEIAAEYNIDWNLVKAVLYLESRYDIKCVTHNYDKKSNIISTDSGIGQQNNQWLEWYGKLAGLEDPDPLNPIHSIKMCCAGLNYWKERALDYTEDEEEIIIYFLNFYNMGEAGFIQYIKEHNKMDRAYSNRVLEFKFMIDEYGYILD